MFIDEVVEFPRWGSYIYNACCNSISFWVHLYKMRWRSRGSSPEAPFIRAHLGWENMAFYQSGKACTDVLTMHTSSIRRRIVADQFTMAFNTFSHSIQCQALLEMQLLSYSLCTSQMHQRWFEPVSWLVTWNVVFCFELYKTYLEGKQVRGYWTLWRYGGDRRMFQCSTL